MRPIDADNHFEWIPIIREISRGYEEDGYPEGMTIIVSEMPEEGEDVLISDRRGWVEINRFLSDDDGLYLDDGYDLDMVNAWAPLPESYRADEAPTLEIKAERHGHWVIQFPYGHKFKCSECGHISWCRTSYCGNCGATMDEGWQVDLGDQKGRDNTDD